MSFSLSTNSMRVNVKKRSTRALQGSGMWFGRLGGKSLLIYHSWSCHQTADKDSINVSQLRA